MNELINEYVLQEQAQRVHDVYRRRWSAYETYRTAASMHQRAMSPYVELPLSNE